MAFPAHEEDLPRAGRQLADGPADGLLQLDRTVIGIRGADGFVQLFHEDLRLLLHLQMPQVIQRPIPYRLQQIPTQAAPVGKGLAPTPQLQKHLLRQILRHGRLVQETIRCPDGRRIPLPEQCVEGRVIAAAESGQEVGIGHDGAKGRGFRGDAVLMAVRRSRGNVSAGGSIVQLKRCGGGDAGGAVAPPPHRVSPPCGVPPDMSDLVPSMYPPDDLPEDALARHVAGECAPEEAARVHAWLAAHPEEATMVSALAVREAAVGARAESLPVDVEAALARVRARLDSPALTVVRGGAAARPGQVPRRWGGARRWGAAAAAALVIGVGFATRGDWSTPSAPRALRTAIGTRDSLRLPDGTLAILAPGSALDVIDGYGREAREVRLVGAAFFEVVHDAARPFAVRTGDVVIRDLGTAFSVNTAADGRVAVAVTHGIVAVRPASGAEVELRAGDRGTADATAVTVRRGVVTAEDVAWTRGVLNYRDTPLTEVRADLRRWYGLDLRITDDVLEARTLTASFRGERAADVIRLIALALGAEAVTQGDTVFLRPLRGADEAGRATPP